MILVRDVFQLKFGKAKEAKALWKKGVAINRKLGYGPGRALVDLTGSYYTFVMETTYEKSLKKVLGAKEWSTWYRKFVTLVESGHREMYTIVE